jgi:dTDP-4-dehydrorhamnose 3,5-epimerase
MFLLQNSIEKRFKIKQQPIMIGSVQTKTLSLPGLKLITLVPQLDLRGHFRELYQKSRYEKEGIGCDFCQDNLSYSKKDVVRGLHFQSEPGQAKLVSCLQGKIFDVAVDLRVDSPTFGQWEGVYLDAEHGMQFFIPVGFAHGFCVVSDEGALVHYKVSAPYNAVAEKSLKFDDSEINILWPTTSPIVSQRDSTAPSFKELFT